MEKRKEDPRTGDRELVITRILDAPRTEVWKEWTEPDRVSRWWGPKGFTSPINKIDLRVGGKYLSSMRSPEGKMFWSTGTYKEIVPLKRLVITDSFSDEDGNIVPASYYDMEGKFPLEMEVVVTFEDRDGKTKMTMRYPSVGMIEDVHREEMIQGWNEQFDKLEADLACSSEIDVDPSKPEIIVTRVFDAPKELVFRTYMDPKLVPMWWGPRELSTIVERMDVKPGGSWRYVQKDQKGNEFAFSGKFKEIVPQERVVSTFNYEGIGPGHEVTETVTFEEEHGKTKIVDRSVFRSMEDRDGMLESGMNEGVCETMDRLDDLLKKVGRRKR